MPLHNVRHATRNEGRSLPPYVWRNNGRQLCDSWHVVGLATSVVLWVDGSPLPLSVNAFWHAMQAARLDGCLSRPRLGKRVAASDCSGAVSLLSAVGLHSGCAPAHDVAQQDEGHWCASVLSSRDLV